MTRLLNDTFFMTCPQHEVTHDSISFACFPGPSQRRNPMWFWIPCSPESHVETSWGVPDILCREINHKSTAGDLHSRKRILRIVPSSTVEPSTSKPDDFIRAGLWRKEKEKAHESAHSEGFTKSSLSITHMSMAPFKGSGTHSNTQQGQLQHWPASSFNSPTTKWCYNCHLKLRSFLDTRKICGKACCWLQQHSDVQCPLGGVRPWSDFFLYSILSTVIVTLGFCYPSWLLAKFLEENFL